MFKQVLIAAAATMATAVPLAGAAHAQAFDRGARHDNDRNDRRDNDRYDRRDNDRRDNDRRANRWDQSRHNGYSVNGRWYYGQPTTVIMGQRGFEPGYRSWRRGERLNSYQRSHYRRVDYRREHLRAPPRGYEYVRSDRGETLLVAVATGVILSVLLSQ